MNKIIAVVAALMLIFVGAVAWFVFRAPEEASGPIAAIPIATTAPAAAQPTAAGAAAPAEAAPTVGASAAEATAPAAQGEATAEGPLIFEIVPSESEARFVIDEVLRGSPTTVVGATDQVAGQISIDPADPTASQVGVIQVNARTLATDNEARNRAIKNFILQTNSFEFITFSPTSITGLPESGAVGESYTFQVAGDLTIRDVTQPATFDVTVTPVSEERLEGTAMTTVLYRDFGLAIPDSPSVDTVADEVRLELEFVAQPAS